MSLNIVVNDLPYPTSVTPNKLNLQDFIAKRQEIFNYNQLILLTTHIMSFGKSFYVAGNINFRLLKNATKVE